MKIKDGGPAFPTVMSVEIDRGGVVSTQAVDGMSLRDYFAGQALAGATSAGKISGEIANLEAVPFTQGELVIANACYRIADAMLKERAK